MKSNDTIKKFNAFISCNFFGYSAHTLFQELCHSYPAEVATQWIYVNIWHGFIGQDTPEDVEIARRVACIIKHDSTLLDRALAACDWIEYCMMTQEYERLAILIDEALDLYIDRVISLDEFRLIVSAAQ